MLAHIPTIEKVLFSTALALLGVPLIDVIDYSIRCAAGALGIVLTVYLIMRARSAKKLDDLNIKIKELELQKLKGQLPDHIEQ